MSDQEVFNIEFIVGSNLTAFNREVLASGMALNKLGASLTQTNAMGKSFAPVMQNELKSFVKSLNSSGIRTTLHAVDADFKRFGDGLEKNALKSSQMRKELKSFAKDADLTRSKIALLAKEQVRMSQSAAMKLDKLTPTGQVQGYVAQPVAADMSSVAAQKMQRQEAEKFAQVMRHRVNTEIINAGKNWQWTGRQLMVGLSLPVVALGVLAVKSFRDVDQELVRLSKVYGNVAKSGDALLRQTAEVREMGVNTAKEIASEWGQSGQVTIGLMADLAATGKEGADLQQATRETSRLMILGEVDKQDAMATTLTLQNAFNVSTRDLAGAVNFLNAVENQTSLSLQDMTIAMPRAGTVIQALGGDFQDLALFMTAMKEGGVDAAEASNAIKSSLGRIVNAPLKAKEQLKTFGIDLDSIVENNKGDVKKMVFALQDAINKNVPQNDKASVFEKLFGKWQFAKMLALFENLRAEGSQTNEVLRLMGVSAGDLANIAEQEMGVKTESATVKFQRALENVKLQLATFGEPLMEVGSNVLGFFEMLLEKINNFPDSIKKILAVGLIGAALLGPFVMLFGLLTNFFGVVKNIGLWINNIVKGRGKLLKDVKLADEQSIANEKLAHSTTKNAKSMDVAAQSALKYAAAMKLLQERLNLIAVRGAMAGDTDSLVQAASKKSTSLLRKDTLGTKKNPNLANQALFDAKASRWESEFLPYGKSKAEALPGSGFASLTYSAGSPGGGSDARMRAAGAQAQAIANKQTQIAIKEEAAHQKSLAAVTLAIQKKTAAQTAEAAATARSTREALRNAQALAKQGLKSKIGQYGMGAALLGSTLAIDEKSMSGYGGIASGAAAGAGMGMMLGPYAAAAGAVLGAYKGMVDKVAKAQEDFTNSSNQSAFAMENMGVTLNDVSNIKLTEFTNSLGVAEDKIVSYKQKLDELPDNSVEKSLMNTVADADGTGEKVARLMAYYKNQAALVDEKDLPNLRALVTAIAEKIGDRAVLPELKLKLSSVTISNKEDAQQQLIDDINNMFKAAEEQSNRVSGANTGYAMNMPNAPGSKDSTEVRMVATQEMVEKTIDMLSGLSFDEFSKFLEKVAQTTGKSLNDMGLAEFVGSLRSLPEGKGNAVADELENLTRQGFTIDAAFGIMSARFSGINVDMNALIPVAGQTAEVMKRLANEQKYAAAASKVVNDVIQKTTPMMQRLSKAIANSGKVAKVNVEKVVKAIEDKAAAAKARADAHIDAMEARAKRAEEATKKNIDNVSSQYDREIEALEKREEARQKAFDAEQKRLDRANEFRNMDIDYLKAINTGNYFEATKIGVDKEAKQTRYANEDQESAKRDGAQETIEELRKKKEETIKMMEEQAEAQRKANEASVEGARKRADAEAKSYAQQKEFARDAAEAQNKAAEAVRSKSVDVQNQVQNAMQEHLKKFPGDVAGAIAAGAAVFGKAGGDAKAFVSQGWQSAGVPELGDILTKKFGDSIVNYPWATIGAYIKAKIAGDEALANSYLTGIKNIGSYGIGSSAGSTSKSGIGGSTGSGKKKKAKGGMIYGNGTGTSDSVPIDASNGEYVIRAAIVKKLGPAFFDAINSGDIISYLDQVRKMFENNGVYQGSIKPIPVPGGGGGGGLNQGITHGVKICPICDLQYYSTYAEHKKVCQGSVAYSPPADAPVRRYAMGGLVGAGRAMTGSLSLPSVSRTPMSMPGVTAGASVSKSSSPQGGDTFNISFGRTTATKQDIEDVMIRVIDQKNARTGNRV